MSKGCRADVALLDPVGEPPCNRQVGYCRHHGNPAKRRRRRQSLVDSVLCRKENPADIEDRHDNIKLGDLFLHLAQDSKQRYTEKNQAKKTDRRHQPLDRELQVFRSQLAEIDIQLQIPDLDHEEGQDQQQPAQPRSPQQACCICGKDICQPHDDDQVRENRAGIIQGKTAETHPEGANEHRQGNVMHPADDRSNQAGQSHGQVGDFSGNCGKDPVRLHHNAAHDQRPPERIDGGLNAPFLVSEPSIEKQAQGIQHADEGAYLKIDAPLSEAVRKATATATMKLVVATRERI